MLIKEFKVPMPISVEEYRIGQLYMIAKLSQQQSRGGDGIQIVCNEPCQDPVHGTGQHTEKRIFLTSMLPSWVQSYVPRIFYITEKAYNFYPYTRTEYSCSFIPKYSVSIETRYENNCGTTENIHGLPEADLNREVVKLDIVSDDYPEKHYKPEEDLTKIKLKKRDRGPFQKDWMETSNPIMCSYKLVKAKFEVWGLQTKVEQYTMKMVQDVLLVGHRQAVAWLDDWIDMDMEELRKFEKEMNDKTNSQMQDALGAAAEGAPEAQ